MVLHGPVELASLVGVWLLATARSGPHSDDAVSQDLSRLPLADDAAKNNLVHAEEPAVYKGAHP